MAKKILIGGGSGFIGIHLTKLLTSCGYDITIVSRMPGIKRITWHDLEKNGLTENTFAIINLAGQNVLDPTRRWTPGFKQNVWNSRINTSSAFVRAITKSKIKPEVYVNVSGVSLYKPNDKVYTERDAGVDYDFMSRLCLNWEAAATLPLDEPTRQIKIRAGVIIGEGGGMIKSIQMPFWLGLGGPISNGKQAMPWIHMTDMCNLIKFCIETKIAANVINGVAPEIITNDNFTKAYAAALHRPAILTVPEFAINLLFGKERAALLTTGAKILPERAMQLGFTFIYPKIMDACKELCS